MTRLLVLEGNPRSVRERAASVGLRDSGAMCVDAIRGIDPQVRCDVAFAADPGSALPAGANLADYQGLVIGGSALHAYSDTPEVARQISLLLAVADTGMPIMGSCWGLQIAAVAAGGEVALNVLGREVGLARKIVPTAAGRAHGLLAGKGECYDALCIHYDEVTRMPPGGIVLAGNRHCAVQAAEIPLRRSLVWGVQYHPEFDLTQQAALFRLYRKELLSQKFFASEAALAGYLDAWEALAASPADRGLAWQLGLDEDTLNEQTRRSEFRNWLRDCVR